MILGGAFKDTQEWKEISAIVTALDANTAVPGMATAFREWLELGQALSALTVSGGGGGSDTLIFALNGRVILDAAGNAVTAS